MALRTIILEGDDGLRKKSKPVTVFGKRTSELMDDLRDTLSKAQGAGLAAPQVGVLRRAVVIVRDGDMVELINPVIIETGDQTEGQFEGCLSCPDKRGWLERPTHVVVRAQDRSGDWFELECDDFTARAACHEIDHLDGVLFVDKVDRVFTEDEVEELLERLEQEAEQRKEEMDDKA